MYNILTVSVHKKVLHKQSYGQGNLRNMLYPRDQVRGKIDWDDLRDNFTLKKLLKDGHKGLY